jgi:serine/threonine-protein kinase RsbW
VLSPLSEAHLNLARAAMPQNGWIPTRDLSITSDALAAKHVIDDLLSQLDEQHWIEHDIFSVHLAVEEAIVNAIKHGNRYDSNKRVRIAYKLSPGYLHIEVTDEGQGFNPADVPDPTDEENLEVPTGRGLMLMRNFMTSLSYNIAGNQVIMEKRRTPES